MTDTVTRELANITIQADGTVIVEEVLTITNGTTTKTGATYAYAPGDSTSADRYDRVKAVCAAVWTAAVVSAYKAAHTATSAG